MFRPYSLEQHASAFQPYRIIKECAEFSLTTGPRLSARRPFRLLGGAPGHAPGAGAWPTLGRPPAPSCRVPRPTLGQLPTPRAECRVHMIEIYFTCVSLILFFFLIVVLL